MKPVFITEARRAFHLALLESILRIDKGVASNADKHSQASMAIAREVAERVGSSGQGLRLAGQMAGNKFEGICAHFVDETFAKLYHLRPGKWEVKKISSRNRLEIAQYYQYDHLRALDQASKTNPALAAALGSDYTIIPDVVILREPEDDGQINCHGPVVDADVSKLTSIRSRNNRLPILHASISCKWTIRSDRAQNARSEGLNLVRNRKGPLPHVVVVTGEPLPSRIASIALGTGDIDCVYHFALDELLDAVEALGLDDAKDMLDIMVQGKRLKDIADLPLDLAI